jgi:hypothetical protein
MEAIEEFLESGAKATKIGSCVIKIAIATELLLKEKLEKICPSLVLETIDESALQVAKLHSLGSQMLNPKELEKVEIRTASFPKLLNRAGRFFDLGGSKSHLAALHNIRNELVHHRGKVDVAEVNLLLIEKIFPFLEQFTKGDPLLKLRLKPEMWKRLRQLAESSADVVTTEIAKKIAHFADSAKRLSTKRAQLLLNASPEIENDEEIVEEGLLCPACANRSLIAFSGWDVNIDDETGRPISGSLYFVMRCKVCGLLLDPDEIVRVLDQFERFLGDGQEQEKKKWEQAIIEPDYSDVYS